MGRTSAQASATARADLVVFDPETVLDRSTYQDPHQYPDGIEYVIVNGEIVVDKGEHTDAKPGRILSLVNKNKEATQA